MERGGVRVGEDLADEAGEHARVRDRRVAARHVQPRRRVDDRDEPRVGELGGEHRRHLGERRGHDGRHGGAGVPDVELDAVDPDVAQRRARDAQGAGRRRAAGVAAHGLRVGIDDHAHGDARGGGQGQELGGLVRRAGDERRGRGIALVGVRIEQRAEDDVGCRGVARGQEPGLGAVVAARPQRRGEQVRRARALGTGNARAELVGKARLELGREVRQVVGIVGDVEPVADRHPHALHRGQGARQAQGRGAIRQVELERDAVQGRAAQAGAGRLDARDARPRAGPAPRPPDLLAGGEPARIPRLDEPPRHERAERRAAQREPEPERHSSSYADRGDVDPGEECPSRAAA